MSSNGTPILAEEIQRSCRESGRLLATLRRDSRRNPHSGGRILESLFDSSAIKTRAAHDALQRRRMKRRDETPLDLAEVLTIARHLDFRRPSGERKIVTLRPKPSGERRAVLESGRSDYAAATGVKLLLEANCGRRNIHHLSVHDALDTLACAASLGFSHGVAADLSNCFARLKVWRLGRLSALPTGAICAHVAIPHRDDPRLVFQMAEGDRPAAEDLLYVEENVGIAPGGAAGTLTAQLLTSDLLRRLALRALVIAFVDNFLVLAQSAREAQHIYAELEDLIFPGSPYGPLRLNYLTLFDLADGIDFLGMHVRAPEGELQVRPSDERLESLVDKWLLRYRRHGWTEPIIAYPVRWAARCGFWEGARVFSNYLDHFAYRGGIARDPADPEAILRDAVAAATRRYASLVLLPHPSRLSKIDFLDRHGRLPTPNQLN